MDDNDLRAQARRTDPETSWQAAQSVTGICQSQWLIWRILIHTGPMIDEEIVPLVGSEHLRLFGKPISPSGVRSRRAELVRLGLVEFSGEWKKMTTGRKGRVWRGVPLKHWRDPESLQPRLMAV
jgi:hypothetical protein